MNEGLTKNEKPDRMAFLKTSISQPLIIINALMALVYFYVICFFFPESNPILFWLLIAGEIFHLGFRDFSGTLYDDFFIKIWPGEAISP